MDELLYNVANWFHRCIDNTIDPICNYEIFNQCVRVMTAEWAELKEEEIAFRLTKKKGNNGKKKNPNYIEPKEQKETKRDSYYKLFQERYNPEMSDSANAKLIGCARHYISEFKKLTKEFESDFNVIDNF